MLITNMNQTFLKDCYQSAPMEHTKWYKKWNKSPKIEISLNFFKIWHRAYLDAADYEYRQRFSKYCHQSASDRLKSGTNGQKLKLH